MDINVVKQRKYQINMLFSMLYFVLKMRNRCERISSPYLAMKIRYVCLNKNGTRLIMHKVD